MNYLGIKNLIPSNTNRCFTYFKGVLMKYSSVLIILICVILISCKENSTDSKNNWLTLPISLVVPQNTTIDGGMFLAQAGKYDSSTNPDKLTTEVALHYTGWPGVIDVNFDNNVVNEYFERFNTSPYTSHIWTVAAGVAQGIPAICDTIPAMQALDITSHSMNDSITKTGTLTWSTPSLGSGTEAAIIITRFNLSSNDTTSLAIIPTDDDGSYTFSSNDFPSVSIGEQVTISVVRLKSKIRAISGKNYIFASMFTNKIILTIKQ